ncbi:CPBP family intramembrane glutamic endopeptidase [Actinomycetes bacterium KLBMP 9759]
MATAHPLPIMLSMSDTSTTSRSGYRDSIPARVPWGELAVFLAVAYAGITVVALLWRTHGAFDDDRDALLFGGIGMFTPALGVVVAATVTGAIRKPRQFLASTGISRPDSWVRLARYTAIGVVLPLVVLVLSLGIGTAAGVYRFEQPIPFSRLVDVLAFSALTFVPLLVLMFGEEWGWGYLLPRLLPLGLWPGILLSGVLWGLFHAPLTMLGYLYPNLPGVVGTLIFTAGSVLLGCLMAWIRLESGSLWPAVALHGSSNLLANPIPATLGAATDAVGGHFHTSLPGGWPSWIVMGTLIMLLAAAGRPRLRPTR